MDDIVVIILTLIVALFGILNKKRKKNVAPGEPGSSEDKTPNFWEMLMDDNEDMSPNPHPYEEVEVEEDEVPVRKARPIYEYSTDIKNSQPVKTKKKRAKKSKKQTLIMGEKFSLKKAVIYSEIINSKYI
ncbi:hypothetical protein [Draconibacterium halophilum]|uniref:Uncharacterized protein n=1 Tax=Draconibacterium halophilum TaxID=2706887 RepID=A0A6C0RAB6_9BACT|nr:hypothetical protein [Draconibacterium halophilum]QIA06912.1 hypothetical protein G0Q07_03805 [Draconibacterium halophilum]